MSDDSNAQAEKPLEDPLPDTELAKARDEMLRALAEVENMRRRADRQIQDARAYAIDRFAADLFPVADALARALAAAPRGNGDEAMENLIAGLELTERALLDGFQKNGLTRVGAKGDMFDPKIHQAVAQQPSDQPAGAIIEVLQPGYLLADRTLRPAMVLVSGGGASPAAKIDITV